MIKHSTFRYLLYLSLVDLLVLTFCTTDSLTTYGYKLTIRLYSPFICRFYTFFTYYLTQMSSVILMVVSVDRALIVSNRTFASLFSRVALNSDSRKMSDFSNKTLKRTNNSKTLTNKSIKHKIEEVIFMICFVLALINIHYLIFLNINSPSSVKSLWQNVKKTTAAELTPEFNNTFHNLLGSKIMTEYLTNETKKLDTNEQEATKKTPSNMSIYLKMKKIESQQNESKTEMNYLSGPIDENKILICFPDQETVYFYFLSQIWIWIDTCIYSLIPFLVMVLCSFIILAEVKSKTRNFSNRNMNEKTKRRNRQLLIMLTSTNAYFIFCSVPLCVNMILYKFKGLQYDTDLFQIISHILAYSNNSVNFIFYLLFSQKYRQVLVRFFYMKIMKRNHDENLQIINMSIAMKLLHRKSTRL